MAVAVVGTMLAGYAWRVSLMRLLLASGIGAVVYVGSLWFLGGPLKEEFRQILSWTVKPHRGAAR